MKISVHDNRILSYCVLADRRELHIQTLYEDNEPTERTDVIFTDVVAYHFEHDDFGTIIFDIEEIDLRDLIGENKEMFEEGRRYGWPGHWNTSNEAAMIYLVANNIKAFAVSSSCGMHGWVLAASMQMIMNTGSG